MLPIKTNVSNIKLYIVSYVLQKLDQLVTIELYPSQSFVLSASSEVVDMYVNNALKEKETVPILLMNHVFSIQHESAIKLFIRSCQGTLTRLIDRLLHYQRAVHNELCVKLYVTISGSLEELLSFIQSDFSAYFDLDQKVTENFWIDSERILTSHIAALKQLIEETSNDLGLLNEVFEFFDDFFLDKEKQVTYRKVHYCEELLNKLIEYYSSNKLKKRWQSLKELLIHCNFNHALFFNFYCQQITEQCRIEEGIDIKINILRKHRKILLQIYLNPGMSLFPQLPSVQDQVVNWINEEIAYIELEIKHQVTLPIKGMETQSYSKISLNLSVAELALLIRILTIDKIITNANQMEVIRFFAGHFKTRKTEAISYGSLYGKYFKPEPSTIREVRSILHRMVTVITNLRDN